ncbi:tail fiber domain-containing protein, partial [Candidatus Zixiibacteriota bacterium]
AVLDGDWTVMDSVMHSAVSGNVGIGTSSPRSKLDVRGTLNVGKYNPDMGYDVTFYGSTGGRLFWDEDKGALRTGLDYDGTHWAPDSVGYSSLATGYNTKAIGHNSIAMGAYTTARGVASTAMGVGTIASGDYSTAMGGYTTASGDYSTTIGRYVTADTTDAIVLGKGINSYYPLINNIPNSLMVGFDTTATLFVGGADDRVGIGTTNPTRKLWINGDAGGTSDWYNDSDERLKKNIKPIENPLDKVNRLKGVTFEWRDTENHFQGQQMGMIAQQVKEVVPEVVQKKGEYYSMATASLVPLLIEAMKELRAENGELRKEIEAIKAEFR